METRIRALRPHVSFLDRGTEHWRPGYVQAIAGATCTIRVLRDPGFPLSYAGLTSALTAIGAAVVEAPLAVRLTGSGLADYAVAELRGSHWGGAAPRPGFVARGEDWWPVIPREITGEPEDFPWTA